MYSGAFSPTSSDAVSASVDPNVVIVGTLVLKGAYTRRSIFIIRYIIILREEKKKTCFYFKYTLRSKYIHSESFSRGAEYIFVADEGQHENTRHGKNASYNLSLLLLLARQPPRTRMDYHDFRILKTCYLVAAVRLPLR